MYVNNTLADSVSPALPAGIPSFLLRKIDWKALRRYSPVGKRIIDAGVSACMLVGLSPLMLLIAAAVFLEDRKSGVIFSQLRSGKDGTLFRCHKFRSMKAHKTPAMQLDYVTASDARVTRLGAFLRASSLDELPQLWNVLKGDMSLVGPRPQPHFHSIYYPPLIPEYTVRLKVKPGLTGLVQVSHLRGQVNSLDALKARVALDLCYIQYQSLRLDVHILLLTFATVLRLR